MATGVKTRIRYEFDVNAVTQDGTEFAFRSVAGPRAAGQVRGLVRQLGDLADLTITRTTFVRWQRLPSETLSAEEVATLMGTDPHDGFRYQGVDFSAEEVRNDHLSEWERWNRR
jgi:hypothetical protein